MVALFVPPDGRLTEQNVLTGTLAGTEVMYIVSPGNSAQGNSYQIQLTTLGFYFASFSTQNPTVVVAGPTYNSVSTDSRILIDLTVAAALTITMLSSSSYGRPILIKDIKGNVDNVNTTTINFSGGQLADGLSSIVMQNAYEGIVLNPSPTGGFYLTAA